MKALPPARLLLWVYAVVGIAAGAWATFLGPLPLWLMVVGFSGYMLLGTAGVLWPERGMYGSMLWRGPARSEVALTFDDGPSPNTTPEVLSLLAAAGARATFFIVGRKALAHPELLRKIVAGGHELALHGFEHDRLFSLRLPAQVAEDIQRTRTVINQAGAPTLDLFRPPIGFASHFTVFGARRLGITLVGCSARALDGFAGANPARVAARLVRALRPGAVLALHDAAERDDYVPASLQALPRVLEALRERKLRTVTLSEWI